MILSTFPMNRREMVQAISEQLGITPQYMFLPTYAFKIGEVTVNRDGTIQSENTELLNSLKPMLIEHGWLEPEKEEPTDSVTLSLPISELSASGLKNLVRILYTKQKLICRMFKTESLMCIDDEVIERLDAETGDLKAALKELFEANKMEGIQIADDEVRLFIPQESEIDWHDAGTLLGAVIKSAGKATRVRAEIQEPGENEKFMANSWLNRMGLGGAEHKELRRHLVRHLKGYAAFASNEQMEKFKSRLAEARRIKREANTETEEDSNE